MKPSELIQLIHRLVKEEVANEVSKAMGKVLVEMVKEIKKPTSTPVLRERVETPVPAMATPKTNNARLNSALEDSAKRYKPAPRQGGSLVELMDGGFDKIGKHENIPTGQPATKMDFLRQIVNESASPELPSVLDAPVEELPPSLQNIFKKDFRSIVALSKEKRGGYSPNVSFEG